MRYFSRARKKKVDATDRLGRSLYILDRGGDGDEGKVQTRVFRQSRKGEERWGGIRAGGGIEVVIMRRNDFSGKG